MQTTIMATTGNNILAGELAGILTGANEYMRHNAYQPTAIETAQKEIADEIRRFAKDLKDLDFDIQSCDTGLHLAKEERRLVSAMRDLLRASKAWKQFRECSVLLKKIDKDIDSLHAEKRGFIQMIKVTKDAMSKLNAIKADQFCMAQIVAERETVLVN